MKSLISGTRIQPSPGKDLPTQGLGEGTVCPRRFLRLFASGVRQGLHGVPRWEEKIPLAKTTLEKTWLFHEIGRCYLELDQAWEAQNYGEKSQQCAEEEGDMEWQLNASVLVAQAQGTDALPSPQPLPSRPR